MIEEKVFYPKDRDAEKQSHCEADAGYPSRILYQPHSVKGLEDLGELKSFSKNHLLIEAGTVPEYCYLVKRGQVVAFEETKSGEELIYYIMEENALFAEANVLFSRPIGVKFKTSVPSEIYCIDKKAFSAAMQSDNALLMDVMESVTDKFLGAMDEIRQIKCYGAPWLLCNLLLIFAERYGTPYDGKVLINRKISLQLLTSMLGVNRATTVRAVKTLKDMNLLENINGFYCIRSVEAMRRHQEMIGNIR